MNRLILVAAAGAILMSGCASETTPGQGDRVASRDDAPLGSLFKRKSGSTGPQDSTQADLQQLENARINGGGTMNLPGGLGR